MTTITTERLIACDPVFNLRDLGGYPTKDGRTVRWRTLFRADGLHRIVDATPLADLGFRTTIDLRTTAELEYGSAADHGFDVVHLPLIRETWDPESFTGVDVEPAIFLAARYLEMASAGGEAIAAAFELFAASDRLPAVFHCSAGKDRTGVLAALVLNTLGVSDELIAEDYHLSAQATERFVAWLTDTRPEAASLMAKQPAAFMACPPEAILLFLHELRAEHQSVRSYLASIGVPALTLARLRSNLLTD